MTTTVGDSVFLDTSLLVAASVELHPGNQAARDYLAQLADREVATCISPQVCREFLVVLTRQPVEGRSFSVKEALSALDEWLGCCSILEEDERVVNELHRLVRRDQVRGKAIHDCNLVATTLAHGIARIGTRNPTDFGRYAGELLVDAIAP